MPSLHLFAPQLTLERTQQSRPRPRFAPLASVLPNPPTKRARTPVGSSTPRLPRVEANTPSVSACPALCRQKQAACTMRTVAALLACALGLAASQVTPDECPAGYTTSACGACIVFPALPVPVDCARPSCQRVEPRTLALAAHHPPRRQTHAHAACPPAPHSPWCLLEVCWL